MTSSFWKKKKKPLHKKGLVSGSRWGPEFKPQYHKKKKKPKNLRLRTFLFMLIRDLWPGMLASPVVPATQEVEVGGSWSKATEAINSLRPYWKTNQKPKDLGHTQVAEYSFSKSEALCSIPSTARETEIWILDFTNWIPSHLLLRSL
jgi:hypothetical protein